MLHNGHNPLSPNVLGFHTSHDVVLIVSGTSGEHIGFADTFLLQDRVTRGIGLDHRDVRQFIGQEVQRLESDSIMVTEK